MSFRHGSYPTKGTRKRTEEKADDLLTWSSSTSSSAAGGERAWDYLLRRKAEDINDRIYKNKAVEFSDRPTEEWSQLPVHRIKKERSRRETDGQDSYSIPQSGSASSSYAADGGFFIDTRGERYGEEMHARVKSEFDDYDTSAVGSDIHWREPLMESYCASDLDRNAKQGYDRNSSTNQQAEESLVRNISSYVEDVRNGIFNGLRHAYGYFEGTHNVGSKVANHDRGENSLAYYQRNSSDFIVPEDTEDAYHSVQKDYGRNYLDQTLPYNMPYDEPFHSERNSCERNDLSDQALIHNTPSYAEDTYYTSRQSYEKKMPHQASSHNVANGKEDLRHFLNNNSCRNFHTNHSSDPALTQNTPNSVEDEHPSTKLSSQKSKPVAAGKKTVIHSLPYPAEGVEVVYTADPVEAEAWLRNNIVDCSACAVGLDIEWKPQFVSKRKGGVENKTAVLQLGVESSCLVVHLKHMKTPPKVLASILNDRKILKVGSGIVQDVAKLKRDTGLKCVGLVDTQNMAKRVSIPESNKIGLKALAEHFLGIHLEKPKAVSKSNWEKFPLTIRQIHYAALDAWIGFKIYQHLKTVIGQTHKGQDESCFVEDEVVGKPSTSKNPVKSTSNKAVEIVSCHVCNKKVKGKDGLAQHMKIHAKCKCGEYFQDKISKSHRKECPALNPVKPVRPVDEAHAEPGWCQGCGKKCKTVVKLMEHIKEVGHVMCPFCTRLLHSSASDSHIRKCRDFVSDQWKHFAK